MKKKFASFNIIAITTNILLPSLILFFFSGNLMANNLHIILIAFSLPIFYLFFEYFTKKTISRLSIVAIFGILAIYSVVLFRLDPKWIAIKESMAPLIIFLILFFLKDTHWDFLTKIMLSPIDIPLVKNSISQRLWAKFDAVVNRSYYLANFSFLLSALLNVVVVFWIIESEPGSVEFNQELAKMNILGIFLIGIPTVLIILFAEYLLFRKISKLSGLTLREILK